MIVSKNILREADIRGVYPTEVNKDVALKLGYVFAEYAIKNKQDYVVVGHDNRFGGPELTKNLIEGLIYSGINVIYIGLVTTPMLNYASHELNKEYGVMVTASHNPKDYNGFKLFGKNYLHCSHEDLDFIYDRLQDDNYKCKEVKEHGTIEYVDIDLSYANYLAKQFNFGKKHLKCVIDCGNGTASTIIKRVYDRMPFDVSYIYSDSNPNFPFHHPDPNVKSNLKDLCKEVKRVKADIGLAYDGDADRIGIVDNHGNVVDADVMMSVIAPSIIKKDKTKPILVDVKCSNIIRDTVIEAGGTYIDTTPSSARQEDLMLYEDCLFGGQYANHIFFRDSHPGYDDGIYAGLRYQEFLTKTNRSLYQLTKHKLSKYYHTDEIKIKTTDDKKWKVVEEIKRYADMRNYKYDTISGIRVIKDSSWALVRASNTGPDLTIRFEATSKRGLTMIQNEFMDVIGIVSK
jgi:phosphomannomutase/phosphoglucomutase